MNNKRERKYMYGKFHADTYEFRRELRNLFDEFLKEYRPEMKLNNGIVDLRNKADALLKSWIGSKKIEAKLGIKIPITSTITSLETFLEKHERSRKKVYNKCEICGEDRITHYCHIVPHSEGGPDTKENYLYLCPIHHHLFDHNRLTREEWFKIDFSSKLVSAQEYAQKVRLPMFERSWNKSAVGQTSSK